MTERLFKVLVKNLLVPSRIGIHQHERLAPQKLRISVEVTARLHPDLNDDYEKALCYADMITRIRAVAGGTHVNLVETLGEKLADDLLQLVPVRHVKVRIEKLEQFKDAESVGIEIEKSRSAQ